MDFLAAYATNEDAEEQGVYIKNGDAEFLIARANNTRFARMLNVQYEGNKQILDARDTPEQQDISDALNRKITIEIMSKSILLGWRGAVSYGKDDDGKPVPLPYSVENAQKLLSHKDFMHWVNQQAGKMSNYLLAAKESDEKNLPPSSGGSSPGVAVSAS